MFVRSVLTGKIRSSFLLSTFSLSTPARVTRQQVLIHVPYARVSTVKGGLFARLPRAVNEFMNRCTQADIFHDSFGTFRSHVISYVCAEQRVAFMCAFFYLNVYIFNCMACPCMYMLCFNTLLRL